MRNNRIRILLLLVMLPLLFVLVIPAAAAGNVTYEGRAREFVFEPGSRYSPTDLFEEFKDVMPGDTLQQEVVIRNKPRHGVKFKLYMRALGAHEGSEEFLSQMNLTVIQENETILFDAPSDQTAQLTDWVCLGTFYSGAEVELSVQLEVPIEMGNDFQEAIGYLDWQFKAEEFPVEPDDPRLPQTGDTAIYLATAVLIVSGMLLVILLAKKKRR